MRDAGEAGANAAGLSDTFHEGFSFSTYEEYTTFKKIRPDLFDGAPEDLRKRWVDFGQTSFGKALRIR